MLPLKPLGYNQTLAINSVSQSWELKQSQLFSYEMYINLRRLPLKSVSEKFSKFLIDSNMDANGYKKEIIVIINEQNRLRKYFGG